jgi:hypothetical protein
MLVIQPTKEDYGSLGWIGLNHLNMFCATRWTQKQKSKLTIQGAVYFLVRLLRLN